MRAIPIFVIMALCIPSAGLFAASSNDNRSQLVSGWLDENKLMYVTGDDGGLDVAFEGENTERIDVQINFSEDFIHFATPIGYLPVDLSGGYFRDIIELTGSAPLIKPVIDDENLFFLAIDLPLIALSKEEVISDIALMVEFTDENYSKLKPWTEE